LNAWPPDTPAWVVDHARRQQRHFAWCEAAWRWLPQALHPRAAGLIARQFSPELPEAAKLWRGLQHFTQCSEAAAHHFLGQWYANQGAFAIELHNYPRLTAAWARDEVACSERAVLARIVAEGGLVLTCHSHHHNRLGAWLGLSGTPVWGIAATEKNSLWKPWTARWVRLINDGSQSRFGGGSYLFTDEMRSLLKASRAALNNKQTVVTLADNPSDHPAAVPTAFAGRTLPVATGMIELALEAGAPIWLALITSDLAGRHRVRLAAAPAGQGAAAVAQAYIAQLQGWLHEAPYAWQGWVWWDDLPPADGNTAALEAWRSQQQARYEASLPAPGWKARWLRRAGQWQMRLSPPRP
jgi:lauroyl/myristoyl acyltransferase